MVDTMSHVRDSNTDLAYRLARALKAAKMAAWDFDPNTKSFLYTSELNTLLGWPQDHKPTFKSLRSRLLPGDSSRIVRYVRAALRRSDHFIRMDVRLRLADGSVRWFLLRAE